MAVDASALMGRMCRAVAASRSAAAVLEDIVDVAGREGVRRSDEDGEEDEEDEWTDEVQRRVVVRPAPAVRCLVLARRYMVEHLAIWPANRDGWLL